MKVDVLAGVLHGLIVDLQPGRSVGLNPATGSAVLGGFAIHNPGTKVVAIAKDIPQPLIRAIISEVCLPSWNPVQGGCRDHTDPDTTTGYSLNVDKNSVLLAQRSEAGCVIVCAGRLFQTRDAAVLAALSEPCAGSGIVNLFHGKTILPLEYGDYRMPKVNF